MDEESSEEQEEVELDDFVDFSEIQNFREHESSVVTSPWMESSKKQASVLGETYQGGKKNRNSVGPKRKYVLAKKKNAVWEFVMRIVSFFCSHKSYHSATFSFVNYNVGLGVIILPYILKEAGVFVGLIVLCFVAVMSSISQYWLFDSFVFARKKKTEEKINTYDQLGQFYYGSVCSYSLKLSVFANGFSRVVIYAILISDLIWFWIEKSTIWHYVLLLIVLFPLCLISISRRITVFRFSSYLSSFSVVCLVVVIIIFYFLRLTDSIRRGAVEWMISLNEETFPRILNVVGTCIFSFDCSPIILPLSREFFEKSKDTKQGNSKEIVGYSFLISIFFSFLIFAVIAAFGYLSFVSNTLDDIVKCYKGLNLEILLSILMFVSLALSFPLNMIPCRNKLERTLKQTAWILCGCKNKVDDLRIFKNEKFDKLVLGLFCLLLLGGLSFLFASVLSVQSIFNFSGGSISVITTFLYPCLFRMRQLRMMGIKKSSLKNVFVVVVVVVSVLIGIMSTAQTLVRRFDFAESPNFE